VDHESALRQVGSVLNEGAELRIQVAHECGPLIVEAAQRVATCLRDGGKVLLFGNGGSAADAQHLAAEFVGRFAMERQALAAMSLAADTSALTAIGNDYGFERVFARQVEALGRVGDVAIGISTSGNSPNVLAAVRAAANLGMRTIALTGRGGGLMGEAVELSIAVPSMNTARIQECHIAIGHLICQLVELETAADRK
jgi:D-sedoheptulose 7-phosphate isomerase